MDTCGTQGILIYPEAVLALGGGIYLYEVYVHSPDVRLTLPSGAETVAYLPGPRKVPVHSVSGPFSTPPITPITFNRPTGYSGLIPPTVPTGTCSNAGRDTIPNTPEEMDEKMGFTGTRQPDSKLGNPSETRPGRNRVDWDVNTLGGTMRITFEQHPYDIGAPAIHTGAHWHVKLPGGARHTTHPVGSPIP